MKTLLYFIGIFIIVIACNYKRKQDSELRVFSKHWWIQILILVIGVTLMCENYD
jgi:hypothetical protein